MCMPIFWAGCRALKRWWLGNVESYASCETCCAHEREVVVSKILPLQGQGHLSYALKENSNS